MQWETVSPAAQHTLQVTLTHMWPPPPPTCEPPPLPPPTGNPEAAREALDHIEKSMPGLIAVTLRRVGLER